MRDAFVSELLRGANRLYMLQKWGAIKPSQPGEPERRWHRPFNRRLPIGWWQLDDARRRCIKRGPKPERHARQPAEAVCPFDERLAAAAAVSSPQRTRAAPAPSSRRDEL